MMKVIKSIAHGSHITLKVTIKKETFLPLLSCEYVYAIPRMRAAGISLVSHQIPWAVPWVKTAPPSTKPAVAFGMSAACIEDRKIKEAP